MSTAYDYIWWMEDGGLEHVTECRPAWWMVPGKVRRNVESIDEGYEPDDSPTAYQEAEAERYHGVYFNKYKRKFICHFGWGGRRYYGGVFDSPLEAAHAHDRLALEHHLARPLNFPKDKSA